MKRWPDIALPFDHGPDSLRRAVARAGIPDGLEWRILRKSLDARHKNRIRWVYAIGTPEPEDSPPAQPVLRQPPDPRPVIVGAGPGGLFAAYWLALHGVPPLLLEQGEEMADRVKTMARFMRHGLLDERSNLGFGAGGAGAYSDGKLMTRIKSPHIPFIMGTFVRFGAPEEIRYMADPHVGSSRIRRVIQRLVDHLADMGVEIRFNTRVAGLEKGSDAVRGVVLESGRSVSASAVLLAAGHSARLLYEHLHESGVEVSFKEFAAGLRLEHPVRTIDRIQLGDAAGHPALGAAAYRLAHSWHRRGMRRALYSFCMCPGGFVLNAATEPDGVVSNGMSNPGRRGRFSNAAMVVNVASSDIAGTDVLRGVAWQRRLETRAAASVNPTGGCHTMPAQRLTDFLAGRGGTSELPPCSCPNPVKSARLDQLLPGFVTEALSRGLEAFNRKMQGLISHDALLIGIETRTSAPVRIVRDPETRQSCSLPGLYPIGEGAGYAGGITSAAADGIESAEAFLATLPVARSKRG